MAEEGFLDSLYVATGPARGTYSDAHFTADWTTRTCTWFWSFGVKQSHCQIKAHCVSSTVPHVPDFTMLLQLHPRWEGFTANRNTQQPTDSLRKAVWSQPFSPLPCVCSHGQTNSENWCYCPKGVNRKTSTAAGYAAQLMSPSSQSLNSSPCLSEGFFVLGQR